MNATIIHPKPGDVLPNGALVCEYVKQYEGGNGTLPGGVVLAHRADEYDRWVTWAVAIQEDGTHHTFGGHYFNDIMEAVTDFSERANNG